MATIPIKNSQGADAGKLELSDAVFGVDPKVACIRAAVNQYRANQRAGTHSTKTWAEVSGGGKKPWKQKGTGRARQGSIRAPHWRGGAIIHGPHPRDYSYPVNRKIKRSAIRSVLSDMARDGRIIAVEDFGLQAPKTRQLEKFLTSLGAKGSMLILTEAGDDTLRLSARNLAWAHCASVEAPNVYDLLNHDYLVAKPSALKRLEGVYAK